MLTIVLLIVFFVCLAMYWNEGMWSNAIMLINVILAALLATNYFEPLADWLDKKWPSYTYMWDFLAIWFLFFIFAGLLRLATDTLSKVRVRFLRPVEITGRILFAVWIGWVMVGFTTMSLHAAPIPLHAFGGAFQETPTAGNFLGMAPDRQWLAFVQSRSRGALSRWKTREFDPQSEFIFKYGARRAMFETEREYRVRR